MAPTKKTTSTAKKPTEKKTTEKKSAPKVTTIYKVRKGDTLPAIAKMYGTTADKIAKENGIEAGLIHRGQRLAITK